MNSTMLRARPDLATILYVEDDDLTRAAVGWQLSKAGFTVLEAASGEQALELAQQRPDVELVLLDVHLPGIDGAATARALRRIYPDVPLVIASAHLTPDARRHMGGVNVAAVIPKPFRAAQIIEILQGLLAE